MTASSLVSTENPHQLTPLPPPPQHSCHPPEHKAATINFLTNRRDSYSLGKQDREREHHRTNTRQQQVWHHRPPKIHRHTHIHTHTTKWAKFTYIGKETKHITKLFKNTTVKIAYTTHNTISKLLCTDNHPETNIKCPEYTNWLASTVTEYILDRPEDCLLWGSANISVTTHMHTISLNLHKTY
jgi:hypothetical protein